VAPATDVASTGPGAGASPATDGCGTENVFVDYQPLTVRTIAGFGWNFVEATVDGFADGAFNTPDGQAPPGYGKGPINQGYGPRIYTPILVSVVQALSGPSLAGSTRFLVEGGTVGCYTQTVDVSPRVTVRSTYVFVLADLKNPAGQPIPGLQEAKFAWPVNDDGTVTTVDGLMTIDELESAVSKSQ